MLNAERALIAALLLSMTGCQAALSKYIRPGVPLPLAAERARTLRNVHYKLLLRIRERIEGEVVIRFQMREAGPVVLDFNAPADHLLSVSKPHQFQDGHIVFAGRAGDNEVRIAFITQQTSIHREPDFLYTLFVPNRASEAFPCFDQPDIKGRFLLTLELPAGWTAAANAPLESRSGRMVSFHQTSPLPPYLFAFAAGRFQTKRAVRNGRTIRFLHRERDADKLERNAAALFDLHAKSLAWMESYTGIAYPFNKFDFVLIPSLPYGGMEHPGSIFYRAERLLLDPSATAQDKLARAHVIAHETAHMWFGDLVTMRWFDDVWTKESFANFMADKITRPLFPRLDHKLRFVTSHTQPAAAVDRSRGANPLHQELDNLAEAGGLYGGIVYHKSPFVLAQLEAVMGPKAFREGLQEYLRRFRFANASWPELIELLDARTPEDLRAFSRAWVYRKGRPRIETRLKLVNGRVGELSVSQSGGVWNQRLELLLAPAQRIPVKLDAPKVTVAAAQGRPAPTFILANGDGLGYGRFRLGARSLAYVKDNLPKITPALTRGILWETLYDAVLEGELPAADFVRLGTAALKTEDSELIIDSLLGRSGKLRNVFWRYLSASQRRSLARDLESVIWKRLETARSKTLKAALFRGYRSIASTRWSFALLQTVWKKPRHFRHLQLSERDQTDLALALAVRKVGWVKRMLDEQAARIKDPELRAQFAFVRAAASPEPKVRDAFFAGLARLENRRKQPWVVAALKLLHHPLRRREARRYILPGLELLEEIQRTGDIFFPEAWLRASLADHNSAAARGIVENFLEARKKLPPRLRLKVLQAADTVLRAPDILDRK